MSFRKEIWHFFLKLTELCGCEEKTDVEAELQGAVETAMKSSILAEEGEDEDEKAMVGKLALVNEAKKYLAEENGREATVRGTCSIYTVDRRGTF